MRRPIRFLKEIEIIVQEWHINLSSQCEGRKLRGKSEYNQGLDNNLVLSFHLNSIKWGCKSANIQQ